MGTDYDFIRKMTGDCKQIANNTDVPLYKLIQLKNELFLKRFAEHDVCSWWLRLYNDKYSVEDLKTLLLKTK